jgi:hypothetical protein
MGVPDDCSNGRAAPRAALPSIASASLLLGVMWASVARDRDVLKPEVSDQEVNAIALATTPNIGLYIGMIALAIIAPRVAVFGYLVIAIIALLRTRGDSAPARTATHA